MAVVSTSSNSANLHSYYVKKALSVFEPRLQLHRLGEKVKLPQGNGKQVKWLQYTAIDGSTSSLTEGTNPSEGSVTTANVTATVAQYGQFLKISDLFSMTAIDDVLESCSARLGEAARKTVELLIIAELDSALTVRYANDVGAVNSVTASDISAMKDYIKASIALKAAYVEPHSNGKFQVVLHPHAEYDLMAEENAHGWLQIRENAAKDQKGVEDGELGSAFGMRFQVSDLMSAATNSGSVSVKNNYILGKECFGVVDISGSKEGFQMIIKDHESGGQSNPLNMYGTVGYKLRGFVAKNFAAGRGRLLKGATSFA